MPKNDFPVPVLPTDDELRQSALSWYQAQHGCFYDQWPDEIKALSCPTKQIILPEDPVIHALFEPDRKDELLTLAEQLDSLIGWDMKMIRTNCRSPKDGCWPCEIPLAQGGKQAVTMLGSSMRCLDDLSMMMRIRDLVQPSILVRDQIMMAGAEYRSEYRCFVKDRKLIAVSEYFYNKGPLVTLEYADQLREFIEDFHEQKIDPFLEINDVVFDLVITANKATLIELNPYGLSDPCWFKTYENVENSKNHIQYYWPENAKREKGFQQ